MTYNHTFLAEEARDFFETLFPTLGKQERIELRYKLPGDDHPMRRAFHSSYGPALDFALTRGQSHEVYMGVAPRQGDVGTKEGVTRLLALWADLDFKGNHTMKTRLKQLWDLPYHPSMVVGSGGGLHPYWLLDEPIERHQDLNLAEEVMAKFAEGLDGDAVYDRTRILRIPGTLNHKYEEPHIVRLVHHAPEKRYTMGQLVQMAEDLPKTQNKTTHGKVRKDVLNQPISEGARNTVLTSVAGSLRDRGLDEATITVVLLEVNDVRCEPTLDGTEVERIAKSVCQYPVGRPRYLRSTARRVYSNRGDR